MVNYLNTFIEKFLSLLRKRAQVVISHMSMKEAEGKYNPYWDAHLAGLNNTGLSKEAVDQEIVQERSAPIAKVSSIIRSPALLFFDYQGALYLVIVTAARGGLGRYNNKNTGNQLLSCFDVTEQDPEIIAIVLESIYNMYLGGIFTYKEGVNTAGLKRIFAKDTFKTFNFLKLGSIEIMDLHG